MKKTLVIYPCTKESVPIVRYPELIRDYSQISMICPKGWNISGKDCSYFDGGVETGIVMSEDFESELKQANTVLFVDNKVNIPISVYIKKIQIAKMNKKTIFITYLIEQKLKSYGYDLEGLFVLDKNTVSYEEARKMKNSEKIFQVNVPVISVYGLGRECNKFEVQLGLRKQFLQDGYKILQLGTKDYSQLFGFERLPEFLYSKKLALPEKIIALNHYICHLESLYKPDVILLGAPGPVMSLHDDIPCGFGELAIAVGSAIEPDISILCANDRGLNKDLLQDIQGYCKYTLKSNVEFIGISHIMWSYNNVMLKEEILTLDDARVKERVRNIQNSVKEDFYTFDCLNSSEIEKMYQLILEKL